MFSHQPSVSRWLAVLCTVTFVVLAGLSLGCSEDDIVGDATAEGVEAGLNEVLADTVSPLFAFFGDITDIVSGGAGFGTEPVCPDVTSFCDGGGQAVCAPAVNQLQFTFDDCNKVGGDLDYTLDGVLLSTPSSPFQLTFNSLFINNGSPALNGTGSADISNCDYSVEIFTDDAAISGTVVQCDTDDFPQASPTSHLQITQDDVVLNITFSGSNTASATATRDGDTIANCTINMANHPATSSCSAP